MTKYRTEFPTPFYAAAGAGDLAVQRLRRLPEVVNRTTGRLRQRFAAPDRDLSVELTRVRQSAERGTAVMLARAAGVQNRAAAGYRRLVAHGERVMAERMGVATGHADPAEPVGIEGVVGPVRPAERPGPQPAAEEAGPAGVR
jgi:hypothetical protein